MKKTLLALSIASLATATTAEPVDERTARKQLFKPKGFSVEYVEDSGLTEQQQGFFKILVEGRDSRQEFGTLARYYGAITVSPSIFEGDIGALLLTPEEVPFQFATGYHSPGAADAASLEACNAQVRGEQKECVIAARILPKRFSERDLTMSFAATANFKLYRGADAPKAFAISPSSQAFGLAEGATAADEALGACNGLIEQEQPRDCVVVIADE
ncbi:5-aminolevulic acid synthase isozyme [Candidatus Rhodobacter oscarellae]|uniref:5-aminolevulic acid synthase isozyme n=1 Tax=Candidatus Rhodobacter oscarellae TaxID=1675527 RepID=A0A0J9E3L8_9RHOB|nr:hypothetical protein [Candidatus Rhodobacter lobularis]KMW56419.1 5-aminolevulic acid synthase isozyme [Candidatus Rhodobacter lobularis]